MIDILGIGELLVDFTPVKTKEGTFFKENPGGAPCNMLLMAQNLGSKTSFIGKVGNDSFGLNLKNTLDINGIDTTGLVLSNDYNTTLAFVHLTDSGERSFSFYRKGCADINLNKKDINYDLIDKAKVVHFGSLSFTDEPGSSTVEEVLKYAKKNNKIISYDPNYRPALWSTKEKAIEGMKIGLKYADIIKISDEELELITDETDYKVGAEKLFNLGIKIICITLGVDGSYYYFKGGFGKVSGFKAKVVDTTGAGDSFFGAVVHQILQIGIDSITSSELERIFVYSNLCASICIEKLGGMPAIPTIEEINIRKDKL